MKTDSKVKVLRNRFWPFSIVLLIGVVTGSYLLYGKWDQNLARVSVLVEDLQSGRPLVGVPVEAEGAFAETGENGRVSFELSPGYATFRVSFVEFRDFFQTINLARGKNEEILFSVELTTTQVRGRVLDSVSDAPVAGAVVVAGGMMGRTGGDGRFTLEDVVIGTATLKVRKDGYKEYLREIPLARGVIEDVGDIYLVPEELRISGT